MTEVAPPIDINLALDKAMYYENFRLSKLQFVQKAEQTQLSAYGSLQNLFTALQQQITSLTTAFNTVGYQVSSDNANVATASITNNDITSGNHTIVVTSLATASQATSQNNSINSETSSLGISETMTISNAGGSKFNVPINSTDTLESIRDKINNNSNNLGMTASIVSSVASNGSTQYYLTLGAQTGTANQFTISGDSYFNFSQPTPATDAQFTFDGLNETSSSNTVTNVMDGLSFTLLSASSSGLTAHLSITQNSQTVDQNVQSAMTGFITAYNQVITFLDANQDVSFYDDKNPQNNTTKVNSAFQLIKTQLENAMGKPYTGTGSINSLMAAGISYTSSQNVQDAFDIKQVAKVFGELMVNTTPQAYLNNQTIFTNNLASNFGALQDYFTNSTSGLLTKLSNFITTSISPSTQASLIYNATKTIQGSEDNTTKLIDEQTQKMDDLKNNLISEYAQINANIERMQNTSDYLTKEFDMLNSMVKDK